MYWLTGKYIKGEQKLEYFSKLNPLVELLVGHTLHPVKAVNLICILLPGIIIVGQKAPFAKKKKKEGKFLWAINPHIKYVFRKKDDVVRSTELYWVAS
jgi:hypothetical protein